VLGCTGSRAWRPGTDATTRTRLSTPAPRSSSAPRRSRGRWHSRGKRVLTYWRSTRRRERQPGLERARRRSLATCDDASTSHGCRHAWPRIAKLERSASSGLLEYLKRWARLLVRTSSESQERVHMLKYLLSSFSFHIARHLQKPHAGERLQEAMEVDRCSADISPVTVGMSSHDHDTERACEQFPLLSCHVYSEAGAIDVFFLRAPWMFMR